VLKLNVVWTIAIWGLSVPLVLAFGFVGYALAIALVAELAIFAVWECRKLLDVRVLPQIRLPLACSAVAGGVAALAAHRLVGGIAGMAVVAASAAALYAALILVFGDERLRADLVTLTGWLPPGSFLARSADRLGRRLRRFGERLHARFYHDAEREALIRTLVRDAGPKRSLEVGCGPGRLPRLDTPGLLVLSDRDRHAVGRVARAWRPRSDRCHFVVADAASLPFRPASFDHVAVLDVLEHVPEQRSAAEEIEDVLAPGGSITFFGPAANWRFPYHRWLRPVAIPEDEVLTLWGHRYRGYSLAEIARLFPRCRSETVVRYHEGALAFRVDVEYTRLPFAAKVALWAIGDLYYRWRPQGRGPGDPICFGARLRKLDTAPLAAEGVGRA
jgi:SAM-dependent methyltransferase